MALARQALAKLETATRGVQYDPTALFVVAYAGMDDADDTIHWLRKGLETHSSAVMEAKVDPIFDPLRKDPRFQEVLKQARLVY